MDRPSHRPRVLIVDDAVEVARRLCDLIGEVQGVEIIGPAYDGAVALGLFRTHAPEIIVLDINMPVVDGLEVLRAVRATGSECIVIVLSNLSEASVRDACLASGADHCLRKSSDFESVADLVRFYAARFETSS